MAYTAMGDYGGPYDENNIDNNNNDGSFDRAEAARLARFANNGTNQTVVTTDEFSVEFQPNVLDYYDAQTYHFKLFITSLEDASSGKILSLDKQIIIAESGVSDLTIDRVELQGIAVPSAEIGTGTQTSIKFEIVEPSGAGLLDKLYYEAISLGIGNWLVMPCFLELTFRGRDPSTGESVESGSPGPLSNMRWVWPVKLTDTKANVTHVGTRYEFTGILYNEYTQSNAFFSLLHNVVLRNITNFGSAMQDLENKLNADQFEKLIANYSVPDTFKIVVDPKLSILALAAPDSNTSTSRASDMVNLNDKTASYNAGTGIDKIIDSLLGNTEYFQEKMRGAQTRAGQPGTANTEPDQMKKLWRIVTEAKPIKFDPLRQDNAVANTIYIVEYDTGVLDVTAAQTGQTVDTLGASKKRYAEYVNKKILKKIYNYIFTGLNDQIYNFDLTLNFAFAAIQARFGGIYYDSGTQVTGKVAQENAENEKQVTDQIRQTLQFINNAKPTDTVDKQVTDTVSAINNSNLSDDIKSRYIKILTTAKSTDRKNLKSALSEIQVAGGIKLNGQLETQQRQAQSLAKLNSANNLAFVSDVNINSSTAQDARAAAEALNKGKLRPIPFREGPQENTLAFGVDPNSDSGRAKTSSVFAQSLYTSLDANLQTVKITIKGDPFWLFPQNVGYDTDILPYLSNKSSEMEAINYIKYAHTDKYNPRQVNLYGTDNFIIVRFRTPRIYNETTGVIDPYTEVETFSGIYKVTRITSKFEMGKFSQELECILDPVINLKDFLSSVEKAVQIPGVVDITSNQSATETQKFQRLDSNSNLPNGQVPITAGTSGTTLTDVSPLKVLSGPATINGSNIPTFSTLPLDSLVTRSRAPGGI